MDLFVERDHVLRVIGRADVPRLARVIKQWCVAAPAVRIAVSIGFLLEEKTTSLQVGCDFRIGGLEKFARVWRHCVCELAARVKGLNHRQVVLQRCLIIVFTVSGRHVNDAGSVGRGHEVAADNVPTLLVDGNEAEPAFVFFSDKIAACHTLDDFSTFRHD